MHLTNYSVNKSSSSYTHNADAGQCQGHKWTLKSLWGYLKVSCPHCFPALGLIQNYLLHQLAPFYAELWTLEEDIISYLGWQKLVSQGPSATYFTKEGNELHIVIWMILRDEDHLISSNCCQVTNHLSTDLDK